MTAMGRRRSSENSKRSPERDKGVRAPFVLYGEASYRYGEGVGINLIFSIATSRLKVLGKLLG